ncbi:MAG: carboxypeptidase regulatory-like domain-containing protein [Armatimonadota bacterium]
MSQPASRSRTPSARGSASGTGKGGRLQRAVCRFPLLIAALTVSLTSIAGAARNAAPTAPVSSRAASYSTQSLTAASPTGRTPKLLWTPERQAVWNRMVAENHPWWRSLKTWADDYRLRGDSSGDWATLVYQMTGDPKYGRLGWEGMRQYVQSKSLPYYSLNSSMWSFATYAWKYDWLYPVLTAAERQQYVDFLNWLGDQVLTNGSPLLTRIGDSDVEIGHYFGLAFTALATAGENPRAGEFLTRSWTDPRGSGTASVGGLTPTASGNTLRNRIHEYLARYSRGGVFIESSEYNLTTVLQVLFGIDGVRTATGKDYFPEWTELLPQLAMAHLQHHAPDGNHSYQWGDLERSRTFWIQHRVTLTAALAGLTQGQPSVGPYLQQLTDELVAWPGEHGAGAKPNPMFFVYFNPYAAKASWRGAIPRGHYGAGQGLLYFHDGWSPTDSFFGAHMPPSMTTDHSPWAFGNFQLFRGAEWVFTNPLGWGQPYYAIGGEAHNSMLIGGLSSMREARGPVAQEFGAQGDYAYLAGSTGGQFFWEGFYQPPAQFLHEWTRSIVYLPSLDHSSDTVVVYDRTDAENPRSLPGFDRYLYEYRKLVDEAPALKQWIIHAPVAPTLTSDAISWSTPKGQSVRVNTLLPAAQKRTVLDEKQLWSTVPELPVHLSERKWQVRISPSAAQQWDTFLNVAQVSNAGTTLRNTLVRADDGGAEGVLVQRSGHPDVLTLFSARQGAKPPVTPLNGAYSAHNPGLLGIVGAKRLLQAGYTVRWTAGGTTQVLLVDLAPSRAWTASIDGAAPVKVAVSTQGVARVLVSGAGSHTLVLAADGSAPADTTPPAVPQGLKVTASDARADLSWTANTESDLAGYHVYRSLSQTGTYTRQTSAALASPAYSQTGLTNGTTYWYRVSAVDRAGNESGQSAPQSGTPQALSYSIAGKVIDGTAGLGGVTVKAGTRTVTTAGDGSYSLAGLPAGTYTVTPSRSGYSFSPTSQSVTVGGSKSGVDFTARADVAEPQTGFLRGVNLNGPAVTIEGNRWLSFADAKVQGLSVSGAGTWSGSYSFPLSPSADADTKTMLQSCVYSGSKFNVRQAITNGEYDVYLWTIENYQSNYRSLDVRVEGALVASGLGNLPLGSWRKYGPYRASVKDGALDLEVARTRGDAVLMGFALFGSGSTPTPTTYSLSGRVTLGTGGLAGATVKAGTLTTTTGTDGTYRFSGLAAGSYTVSASKAGYTVSPTSQAVTLGPDKSGVNFAATAVPSSSGYFRGINLGGPAVTIGGQRWLSHSEALGQGLSVSGAGTWSGSYTFPLSPSADADTRTMLQSCLYSESKFNLRQTLPSGQYDVYLWTIENWRSSYRSLSVRAEGATVASGIGTLPLGSWRKYGPYRVTVQDGALDLEVARAHGDAVLFGLSIQGASTQAGAATFRMAGGESPSPVHPGFPMRDDPARIAATMRSRAAHAPLSGSPVERRRQRTTTRTAAAEPPAACRRRQG